jgi:hypothetical protein
MKKTKFAFFEGSELMKGSLDIKDIISELIKKAKKNKCIAACIINDRTVLAKADSDVNLLFRDQMRSQYGLILQSTIGPYPEKELSEKEEQAYANAYVKNK